METKIDIDQIYATSDDVVAREVQGEFIIVPITSGVGNLDGQIFSMNKTARAVWDKLDGKKSVANIIDLLLHEFDASRETITDDCLGIMRELLRRKMIFQKDHGSE